nr:MAG TPA: head tail connector [Caudoviricetes sp.]
MMEISKVSDITVQALADYLRIADPSDADNALLAAIIKAVPAYVSKYTGLSAADLDKSPDFVIAALCLAQDMYDNRSMYVDSANPNLTAQSILDMHSINLLPSGGDQ